MDGDSKTYGQVCKPKSGETGWRFMRAGCVVIDAEDYRIAHLSVAQCDEDEINRRGHVIAAAPELLGAGIAALEALDNILPAHKGQHEYAALEAAFNALEAAIAKAEGRAQ